MSELIDSDSQTIIEKIIKPDFDRYLGSVFEKVSKQFLNRQKSKGQSPFYFIMLGRWWEKSEEVDVVAFDQENNLLIGECKWSSSPVGQKVLNKMMRLNTQIMPNAKNTWYYLFSKSGFTNELIDYSKLNKNILLIALDQME